MLSKKPIKKGVKIVQKIMYEGNKKYHTGLLFLAYTLEVNNENKKPFPYESS